VRKSDIEDYCGDFVIIWKFWFKRKLIKLFLDRDLPSKTISNISHHDDHGQREEN
jgi:hypothetical protein